MVDGGQQRRPVYEPARHFPNQEPIYATGSYLPPHQRRPPPLNSKPVYRPQPTEAEGQEGSLTANLESNGVYISKTPNPKFSENYAYSQNPIYGSRPPETPKQPPPAKPEKKAESETDDDGGFKTAMRARPAEAKSQAEELEKENQESMEKAEGEKEQVQEGKQERPSSRNEVLSGKSDNYSSRSDLLRQENKVSSATSSDYEKATKRSIGQGSSIGDSGRGSAAYSSGRQESGRGSAEYSSGREKQKERPDTSNESSDGIKRDGGYSSQKSLSRGAWGACFEPLLCRARSLNFLLDYRQRFVRVGGHRRVGTAADTGPENARARRLRVRQRLHPERERLFPHSASAAVVSRWRF